MLERGTRQDIAALLTQWSEVGDTKAAYDWFRPREQRRFWAKYIWKEYIPPKYSFICWLAIKGRLPTHDRIKWDDSVTTCALCLEHAESADHLFFKCAQTRKIWSNIRDWVGFQRRPITIKSAIKWLARDRRASKIVHATGRLALQATVYFIWLARNSVIKDGKRFDDRRILFQIKTATYGILYAKFPSDQVIDHVPDI